jgi:hypothetical protein
VTGKVTEYGFEYGAATVERLASHKGYVVIGIRTPKIRMEITVTPSGLMRLSPPYPVKKAAAVLEYDDIAEANRRRG